MPPGDVMLSGGEAGVRDLAWANSDDVVEGNAFGACSVAIFSTASVPHDVVRSLGGLIALLRMTLLFEVSLCCAQPLVCHGDVILSGGEAGVRDLTWANSDDVVEGNAFGACSVAIFFSARVMSDVVRSFGGLTPSSG